MEKYYLIVKDDKDIVLDSELPFKKTRTELKRWNVGNKWNDGGISDIEHTRLGYREFSQLPLERQMREATNLRQILAITKYYEEDVFRAYPSDKALLKAFKKAGYTAFLNRDRFHDIRDQMVRALYAKFEEWKDTKVLLPYDPKEVRMRKNWMQKRKDVPIMVIDETGTLVYCVSIIYCSVLFPSISNLFCWYGWADVPKSVLYMPRILIGADGSYAVRTKYTLSDRGIREYKKIRKEEIAIQTDDPEAYDKWLGDLRKILV